MPEWLHVILRSLFFLVVLFLITKSLGKKQISQLSFFEYVTGITIGDVGAEMATEVEGNIFHGVLSIIVFAFGPFLAGFWAMKSKTVHDTLEGKATVFIKDGKILEDNLMKEKYTNDELLELLRSKDVFDISTVEFAILEASGDFSVLLKKEYQPVTPKDLNMKVPVGKEPQTVIMDAQILDEPLATIGLSRNWLHTELKKRNVLLENVFLAQVNASGDLALDLYDDQLNLPKPTERPMLLATMKKCQADLELFALSTDSKEAKDLYKKNSLKLQKAIDEASFLLKD